MSVSRQCFSGPKLKEVPRLLVALLSLAGYSRDFAASSSRVRPRMKGTNDSTKSDDWAFVNLNYCNVMIQVWRDRLYKKENDDEPKRI